MILRAYAAGIFPMAETRDDDEIHWIDPRWRGVMPLDDGFHVPKSLRKAIRKQPYRLTCDTAFEAVIAGCAEIGDHADRWETWINDVIEDAFVDLHHRGYAHSVEAWDADGHLVGGLYGLALGGAFFGESMFSRATNASKIALCHLVAVLRRNGFVLLDTQFVNDHLVQFGIEEIPKAEYHRRLAVALEIDAEFYCKGVDSTAVFSTHSSTQTS